MTHRVAKDQLRSIVERIERLEEEKAAIADDVKAVYAEAKANGYDTRTLRAVVRIRKQDAAEREEQEALLDLYLSALGMTPIERAIAAAEGGGGETEPPPEAPEALRPPLKGEAGRGGKGRGKPRSPAAEFARDLGRDEASFPRRVGKRVRDAVAAMGTPAELTDEERAKGYSAAFIGKDGTRMAIGAGVKV